MEPARVFAVVLLFATGQVERPDVVEPDGVVQAEAEQGVVEPAVEPEVEPDEAGWIAFGFGFSCARN